MYGALVKGGRLHYNIEGAGYIGDYFLDGYAMYSIMDRYPGIIPRKKERILGEVYEINYDTLRKLDRVEGEDYHRSTVTVTDIATGDKLKCKSYIYTRLVENCNKVAENTWPVKRVKVMGYGSLMNTADFMRMFNFEEQRDISKAGNGILKGYKLGYTYNSTGRKGGVLDVVKGTDEDYVVGVVNEMPYSLMVKHIDVRESNGSLYQREPVPITINGKPESAYCYFVLEHKKDYRGIAPADEYNEIVLEGMHENNFPEEYIGKYLQYVAELKR